MANESVPAGKRPRIGSTPRVSSDFFPREAGFSPAGRTLAAYDARQEDGVSRAGDGRRRGNGLHPEQGGGEAPGEELEKYGSRAGLGPGPEGR